MKKVYEITDIDSGLEYIKDVAPHLYDSTIESLQIIEEESNDISDRIFYNLHIAFSDPRYNSTPSIVAANKMYLIKDMAVKAFEFSAQDVAISESICNYPILIMYLTNGTDLTIDGKYETISEFCFKYCDNLKNVSLNEGIQYINEGAFCKNESLEQVSLPSTLISIRKDAFRNCRNLTTVHFANERTDIHPTAFEGTLWMEQFEGKFVIINNQLLNYYGNSEDVIIPEGVITISTDAFSKNRTIRSVTCPSSLHNIGISAFSDCVNLSDIKLSNKIGYISNNAFSGCESLLSVELPDSIELIGRNAFDQETTVIYNGNNPFIIDLIKNHFTKYILNNSN